MHESHITETIMRLIYVSTSAREMIIPQIFENANIK